VPTAALVADSSMTYSRQCILVVEDDSDVVRLLLRVLVGVAQDCDVAVLCDAAVFSELGSRPVPLVITDFSLLGTTGVQLAAVIKQQWPNIHVVLISGDSTLETRAQTAGVDYYLPKPFPLDALERIVRAVLA
jgi:two-component system, response regulator, stage 0 sporulation protein F